METFILQVFWAMFITMAEQALIDSPQSEEAQAANISGVNAPTISEGAAVPVIFGTVLTGRQCVTWYGGLTNKPVSQEGVVTGYKYNLSAQLTLCHGPIDRIQEIRVEDTPIPTDKYTTDSLPASEHYWDYLIDAPEMLGGDKKDGGVSGHIRIYKGTATQGVDHDLETLMASRAPAWRGVAYAVLYDFYLGTSPRLKNVTFLIQRLPKMPGLGSEYDYVSEVAEGLPVLDGDGNPVLDNQGNPTYATGTISVRTANPIVAIYDLMTSTVYGGSVPESAFDMNSWLAAAIAVHNEGIGISLMLTNPSDMDKAVQDLLQYADAAIYEEPSTGKIAVHLVRAPAGALQTFDQTNISTVSVTRRSWTEMSNTAKVTYTDPGRNYQTGGVMAQNSSAVEALGGAVDLISVDLPGIYSSKVAMGIAERSMRISSYPLSKVEITADRSMSSLRPGDAFHLRWERPNIDAIYRVARIMPGSLEEHVTVSAVEDVFSAATNLFTVPQGTAWTSGATQAQPVQNQILLEAPYHLARADTRSMFYGAQAPSSAHSGYHAVVSGVPTADTYGWMLSTKLTAGLPQFTGYFVLPTLTLAVNMPTYLSGTPTITDYNAGKTLILIGDELLAYGGFTRNANGTTTFTQVARGVLDTVPSNHPVGSRVIVFSTLTYFYNTALVADGMVQMGAQTVTLLGAQDLATVPIFSAGTSSRALRPYPPADIKVSTEYYPSAVAYPAVITWTGRDRSSMQVLNGQQAGTQEPGVMVSVQVLASNGDILEYVEDSTGTVTLDSSGPVVIQVWSQRGALKSYQTHRLNVTIGPAPSPLTTEAGDYLAAENSHILIME